MLLILCVCACNKLLYTLRIFLKNDNFLQFFFIKETSQKSLKNQNVKWYKYTEVTLILHLSCATLKYKENYAPKCVYTVVGRNDHTIHQ
jgi:hypothetical protein